MSEPNFTRRTIRPRDLLDQAGRDYPGAWAGLETYRDRDVREELGGWPDWCFLPMAAYYAAVSKGGMMPPHLIGDVARLAALGIWRYTQGIYRIDPALLEHIAATPLERDMPCDVLMRLPEWCLYIETPGMQWLDAPMHGFFAHLEWDMGAQRTELRLLVDSNAGLTAVPLHLGQWPLAEAVNRYMSQSMTQAQMLGIAPGREIVKATSDAITADAATLVNLLLFIVSQASDIGSAGKAPGNPAPVRTKKGWRLFPADGPRTWDVGVRLGSALRRAYQAEQTDHGGTHAGPRPHVRRAHWHGFWSGPRAPEQAAQRRYDVRWLPPIPVNLDEVGDLPAVVRKVGGQ